MSGLSDIDKVYQGVVDLHNAEQVVSREALAETTGLKMSEITKFTKLLVEHGKIYRVTRGIFKPAIGFGETRPVSVSVLDSGMGVLEIGDTVLHLNPQEMRSLGGFDVGVRAAVFQYSDGARVFSIAELSGMFRQKREVGPLMPRLSDEDWRKVELDYRRGVLSIAEIGRKYNVSAQHVGRVAKERVWTRDLNDEVQAKARAMVLSADKNGNAPDYADFNLKQVTDAEAKRVAAVQRRHRNLAENLSKSAEQIVAELYGSPEDTFTKARMFQTVAAGFKVLVEIERKSYGMDTAESKISESAKTAGIRIEFVGPEDDGKDG